MPLDTVRPSSTVVTVPSRSSRYSAPAPGRSSKAMVPARNRPAGSQAASFMRVPPPAAVPPSPARASRTRAVPSGARWVKPPSAASSHPAPAAGQTAPTVPPPRCTPVSVSAPPASPAARRTRPPVMSTHSSSPWSSSQVGPSPCWAGVRPGTGEAECRCTTGVSPGHAPVTRAVDTHRVSEATVDVADLRHHGGVEGDAADAPLREDIRLLGRVLGEVIGEQSGDDVLALVESTRVEAFRLRRSEVDRADVAARLAGLDVRSANHVIRAFSHFSLLANLAEDLHHERRRRFHRMEGSPPQKGSLAATFELLDAAHLDADVVARELAGALVCPVVTAHPTEIRRRTISRVQRQITELIRRRDRSAPGEADDPAWSAELQRAVLTLWQTALLRLSRLRLADEIDEALRYYELSLFEVVPAINAELRRALRERWPSAGLDRPLLLPGSWIGGGRGGHPLVAAP